MRFRTLFLLALPPVLWAAPASVSFTQSAPSMEAYDFVEVSAQLTSPDVKNCFSDAALTGSFHRSGAPAIPVEGFCDAMDGSVYRIRFMPSSAGDYAYSITFHQGAFEKTHSG